MVTMSVRGHHHLADDGVAELEDRVDHLPLARLDDRGLPARSTRSRSSASLVERAVAVALARRDRVAERDEQPRDRPEDRAQPDQRPGRRAGRTVSECWRPRVRGETPTTTKDTTAMMTTAISSARQTLSTRLRTATVTSTAASPRRRPGGRRRRRGMRRSRRRCVTRAARRRPALLGQLGGADPRDPAERGLGGGQEEGDQQAGERRTSSSWATMAGVGVSRAGAAAPGEEGQQQLALQLEHLAFLVRLGVVVAEQVQDAVRGEQLQLLLGGVAGVLAPASRRPSGTARCRRAGPPRAPRRPGPGRSSSIGKASTSVGPGSPSTARGAAPWPPRRPALMHSSASGWTRISSST